MSRTYGAIPTRVLGVNFRSRLEAKWACVFQLMGWAWSYEPIDLAAHKIPDFVVHFRHPIIIECKPAMTIREIDVYRAILHRAAQPWILEDLTRRLATADAYDEEIVATDALLADVDRVEAGDHPRDGRRALVAGSQLFIDDTLNACSIDGRHYFTECEGDRAGLVDVSDGHEVCLACGDVAPKLMRSSDVLRRWRDATNKSQWRPVT